MCLLSFLLSIHQYDKFSKAILSTLDVLQYLCVPHKTKLYSLLR